MELVVLSVISAVLQVAAAGQTTVYVKFLSPPHGYSHNLQLNSRGGIAVSKEERLYPADFSGSGFHFRRPQGNIPLGLDNRFRQERVLQSHFPQTQQPSSYYYPRPSKPFEEYGLPSFRGSQSSGVGPPQEPYEPTGEYYNPDAFALSQHQSEVTYDPNLITGAQAAQYVNYLFSRGELFFHLIPHERLVLMNQQERIENNLVPHLLASIRPGHPFFFHR